MRRGCKHVKRRAAWAAALLGLLVVLAGCGRSLPASGLNDLLRPTWTPVYAEPATLALDPAQTAEPTPTDKPVPTPIPFEIGAEVYRHPGGLFRGPLPAGWAVSEEADDQVVLTDARWPRLARIGVTHTGSPLDGAAFERFVTAREINRFAGRENYELLSQSLDPAGHTAVLEKVYTENRQLVWGTSYYHQTGAAVVWLDFQQANYLTPYLAPPPADWMGRLEVDPRQAARLAPYAEVIDWSAPGGLYQLQAPAAWSYRKVVRDSVVAHLIEDPNQKNRIQLILFDEGQPLTQQEAGNLALELVRSLNVDAIQISAAVVRSDGLEYLIWSRVADGSRGQSFFTVRGTTFLMLTTLEIDLQDDDDRIPLEAVINSFRLP